MRNKMVLSWLLLLAGMLFAGWYWGYKENRLQKPLSSTAELQKRPKPVSHVTEPARFQPKKKPEEEQEQSPVAPVQTQPGEKRDLSPDQEQIYDTLSMAEKARVLVECMPMEGITPKDLVEIRYANNLPMTEQRKAALARLTQMKEEACRLGSEYRSRLQADVSEEALNSAMKQDMAGMAEAIERIAENGPLGDIMLPFYGQEDESVMQEIRAEMEARLPELARWYAWLMVDPEFNLFDRAYYESLLSLMIGTPDVDAYIVNDISRSMQLDGLLYTIRGRTGYEFMLNAAIEFRCRSGAPECAANSLFMLEQCASHPAACGRDWSGYMQIIYPPIALEAREQILAYFQMVRQGNLPEPN